MSSFCRYYNSNVCRSCQLIEVDYPEQLTRKEDRLRSALSDFKDWELLPSTGSKEQGFRNKAKLVVTGTLENPIFGLEEREILHCPVHHPTLNAIIEVLPDFARLAKLAPYDRKARAGELKGVIAYHSEGSGESYVRFVLRSRESLDRIKKNLTWLQSRFPSLTCISANLQPIPHAILEGEEEIILSDEKSILHLLGPVRMRLNPRGFVQTNQSVAGALYQTAAEWARDLKVGKFTELFCGQGAFSFFIAPNVTQSLGFEINADAVAEANRTAKELSFTNASFKCADAAHVRAEVQAFAPDLLLVNPPRRGLGESIGLFTETPATYLIYSSCSVESLGKDLRDLSGAYAVVKARIFDMFPHTEHFETLVLLRART